MAATAVVRKETASKKYSRSFTGDDSGPGDLKTMTAPPRAGPPVGKYAVSNPLHQSCQGSGCQIMKPPQAAAPRSSQTAPTLMASLKSAAGGARQGQPRAASQVSPRSVSKSSSFSGGKANRPIGVAAIAAPPPAPKSPSATDDSVVAAAGSYGGHGSNPAVVAVDASLARRSPSLSSDTPVTTSAVATRASPAAAGSRIAAAIGKPAGSLLDNSAMDTADSATRTDKTHGAAAGHDSMSNHLAPGNPVPEISPSAAPDTGAEGGGDAGGGPIRNLRVRGQRKFLPEKTRHKRQTLQDMTRPLKQWLLKHRDNPYPSKAEKMELVSTSQMTLTQVSNWFANARRRLKNTVKQPDLTWASRIKLYNSCVQGNAELFSICSDDSCPDSDDDMMEQRQCDTFHDDVTDSLTSSRTTTPDVTAGGLEGCGNFNHGSNSISSSGSSNSNVSHHHHHHHHSYHHSHCPANSSSAPSGNAPSGNGPPAPSYTASLEDGCGSFHKYKHSILHRYLSDAHQQALILDEDSVSKSRDRHHSSSTGSRDFEELSTSSVSSPAHESTHHDHLDDFSEEFETMALKRKSSDLSSAPVAEEEEMYWKEIGAALALTSLARGRAVTTVT